MSSDRNQNGGNNRKAEKAARRQQQQQQSTETGGLFLGPNGHYKTPMLLLSASVPLFLMGHWVWGLVALLATLLVALCNAMEEMMQEEDKQKIRHDVMNANDVLVEMMAVEESMQRVVGASKSESEDHSNNNDDEDSRLETIRQGRLVILTGLGALAKKYNKQLRREQEQRKRLLQETTTSKNQQHQEHSSSSSSPSPLSSSSLLLDPELPLLCQQAAYIGLRLFGQDENDTDTTVVAAAISLAALVAKDARVRERHLYQADVYGLHVPIRAMKSSLTRARKLQVQGPTKKDDDDKAQVAADPATAAHHQEEEEAAAELQRKSCLFLGALADDSNELACLIANEGGLQAILEAADWFRYHVDVANWALWAIFILCFENLPNKVILVRDGSGIPIVLQTMRNCPDSIDVARHGIAILFDLMRQDNDALVSKNAAGLDVWKIRNLALAAGLHPVLAHAVQQFGDQALDIKTMGGEILTGTDYQGDIALATPQVAQLVESSMLE